MNRQELVWNFTAAYAIFKRDTRVFWKEIRGNLIRILGQPLFFLTVFGLLIPRMSIGFESSYTKILVPGVISMTTMLGSMRSVAGEIALSFDHNEEIRSHILLPISMWALSLEKIVYGMFQGVFSGASVLVISLLMFPNVLSLTVINLVVLVLVFMASGIIFGGLGLAIGSTFKPPEIMFEVMFVIMMPMMFFGATFYPITEIIEINKAFFYVTLGIPLTYISEAIRSLVAPQTGALSLTISLIGMVVALVIFVPLGIWGFKNRAIS
ncbi:hypothetical protein C9439_04155 [archaeon SCG-AAA382B04]|nr:hypothetical protein C9439_04155 [archaeon SCG-AAA382B04]